MKRALCLLAVLCLAVPAVAQVDRATLSGTVRDEQGGAIAAASVAVTNVATNVTTRVRTTSEGAYLVPNLIPGSYRVQVEAGGFETQAEAVILEVGQRGRLDFAMKVGTLTEAVEVVEARRLLNTEQSAVGTVIDQNAVAKLPLAIRNWDDLLSLVAGVQGDRYSEEGGSTSFGRTGGVNVHGQRSLQNNFLLDGVDNNSISTNVQELTTQVSRPSIDAIQEFKVVTSPYSAEYGRSPGAAIVVNTKSGTNQLHGTVYEYHRNEGLDSNTFFAKRANAPKPENNQNQFGANLGGPIVKDKAFFFVDYEGTRITRGTTRITRVPTMAERQGRFSVPIRDPLTGQPFPNNTIPADRIDPVAAAVFGLLPEPNQSGTNNFFRQPNVEDDADRVLARFDLAAGPQDTLFARYIYSNRDRFIPGAFGGVIDGTGTSAFGRQDMVSHGLVAGWTRIFGASVVNEFRVSYTKANSDAVQDPFGQLPPAPIAAITPSSPIINGGLPGITIDGFFGGGGLGRIGSPDFLPKFQRTEQMEIQNTLSWIRGSHQIKFGANVMPRMRNEYLDVPAMRGALRFRGRFTGGCGTSCAVADFLLGYVSDAQLSNVYVADQRHWAASGFVQDDWKVNGKLTLNLGLRYDFITPALEAQNRQSNFVPEGGGRLVFASDGSLEDRGLVKPDRNNFAPRAGFVYTVNERTVVRGGYGLFYNMFDRIGSEDQLALNPPGLVNNSLATSSTTTPLFLLRGGFPAALLQPLNLDPAAGQLRNVRIRAVSADAPKTAVHQLSLGAQRELVKDLVLSVDAVASFGRNLANLVNLNQPFGGTADRPITSSGPVPFPNFGFVEWREHNATSEYKGVDVSLEKRFARGYSFGIAYTLSESRDTSAEHLATGGSPSFSQEARNVDAWEGPSGFDTRHRLVTNFVVELPFGEGKPWATAGLGKALFGDWTISGIFAYRSGRPFTVTQGSNFIGQSHTAVPNLVGDPEGPQTVEQWFNKAAFQRAPNGVFGNVKRNSLRGPDWRSFDLSLSRRIDVSQRVGAVLRWDVFNVFNRTNLGLPDANIDSGTFGVISSLSSDPRTMQLSLRLLF